MEISAGDWLSFAGSCVGAAAGVFAAFLAVDRQRKLHDKAAHETIRNLIDQLHNAAIEMEAAAETAPSPAARVAYRAFCAVRDVAIGVRISSAAIATIAARMEYTAVYSELKRLVEAPENGIVAPDARGQSAEIISLCADFRRNLGAT